MYGQKYVKGKFAMKYDAFISYKHAPLDLEIAKKIHKTLENYHIPKAVQKRTGMKRINRVFRDQEELMVGSDLDGKIEEALKHSVYLVVICSPRTPESVWVQKEIDTFIKLHGRERILAVLIEGEPNESFPKALLVDDNGKPVEPLAADVRGRDAKERNNKFKIEFLRLAAALIGCSFDDLKQRHREHKIRQTMFIIAGAAAVLVTFGAIFSAYNAAVAANMRKLAEERKELMEETSRLADDYHDQLLATQINQSKFYAREALDLLENGNREDAVLVASEGLPRENNPRPYVSEAEYALACSLYAYEDGSIADYDRILSHNGSILQKVLSPDETRLTTVDSTRTVRVFDTSDWEILFEKIPEEGEAKNVYACNAGNDRVYVSYMDRFCCFDYEGNLLYEAKPDSPIRSIQEDEDAGCVLLCSFSEYYILDAASGSIRFKDSCPEENGYYDSFTWYNPDSKIWILSESISGKRNTFFDLIHADTGEAQRIEVSNANILKMNFTENGNIIVMTSNQFMDDQALTKISVELYAPDGTRKWTRDLGADIVDFGSFSTTLTTNRFTLYGQSLSEVIAIVEYSSFTLNEEDGSIIRKIALPGSAKGIFFDEDSPVGNVLVPNGRIVPVDFDNGVIYEGRSFNVGSSPSLMAAKNFLLLHAYSSDLYVITNHTGKDYKALSETAIPGSGMGVAPSGKYLVQQNSNTGKQIDFFQPDGKLLYSIETSESFPDMYGFRDDYFCLVGGKSFYEADPVNKTVTEITSQEYGLKDLSYSCISGDYSKLFFLDTLRNYCVIDLVTKKSICSGKFQNHFDDNEFDRALLSDDGQTLYVFSAYRPLWSVNLTTGETQEYETEKYITGETKFSHNVALSDNGNYIAFSCEKGNICIFDTEEEEMHALFSSSGIPEYLKFLNDGTILFIQSQDTVIHFFNIERRSFINYYRPGETIRYIEQDPEDGLLAVCTGTKTYLFNEDDFGILARVLNCTAFLKENNLFFLGTTNTFGTIPYKNYEVLLKEAKEAFPFSALSDEKKVKYNIN